MAISQPIRTRFGSIHYSAPGQLRAADPLAPVKGMLVALPLAAMIWAALLAIML